MTNDQVNSGTKHSSSEGELCPRPAPSDGSLVGRELDAVVAEGVMGLVPCQSDQHAEGAKFYIERPCHAQPDSPNKGGETLCYSTDISAAWAIVDHFQKQGYLVSVNASSDNGQWWCVMYPPVGVYSETEYCDSAPEAICRAALHAVAITTVENGEHGPTQ